MSTAAGWTVPRLSDGRPDLQGVWENYSATPLERPREFANKPRLSDDELEALKRKAGALFDETRSRQLGATGTYSANWLPDRLCELRTSLIESPVDGRRPPATPENAKLRAARAARALARPASASDGNLSLTERFTRVADDTMRYEFTVNDPTVWTAPWTAVIYWKRAKGEIYEYACHEGNYSLRGMLSGARADEGAAR